LPDLFFRKEMMSMTGFKDVIGHNDVIEYMQNAIKMGQVSHAYILSGARGSGKKMLANLFAQTLQCEEQGVDPCGTCHSCKQAESGNHPDIIHVQHEKPNTIGVEDVREQVVGDVMIKPYSSPYKIYIIAEADKLSVQAQNALLKTIEEPPAYAIIFLLVENADSLLATIRSRCVMLKLKNIKDKLIKKHLMEYLKVPDYKAEICTAFAQGNMGQAVMLAQSEHFKEIHADALQLAKHVKDMELSEISATVKDVSRFKLEITDFLDILGAWYRDVLLYKATQDVNALIFQEEIDAIQEQANRSSYEGIELILQSLENAKTRLRANVNFDLVMELLFLTIKEN
jgi:DNA polymerase-3 subunit delta'